MSTIEPDGSLIDWSSPIVEYSNKPLIPVPVFISQIQITEDDPFDSVEKQLNNNDPFDVLSINRNEKNSFHHSSKLAKDSDNESKEINVYDFIKKPSKLVDPSFLVLSNCDLDKVFLEKEKSNNTISSNELSVVNTFSDLELKEILSYRISNCINQALNKNDKKSGIAKGTSFEQSEVDESVSPITNTISNISRNSNENFPEFLNCGFLSSKEFKKKYAKENNDFSLLKMFGEYDMDLQSIVPNWDDVLMNSSSDDETEKLHTNSASTKSCYVNPEKINKRFLNKNGFKQSLSGQTLVKKSSNVHKEGPLKATIPIECMSKNIYRSGRYDAVSNENNVNNPIRINSTARQKRWSAPLATSTPTDTNKNTAMVKLSSITSSRKRNTGKNSRSMSVITSRPISPDSTSSEHISKLNVSTKISNIKGYVKKSTTNTVSSSTNIKYSKNTPKKLLKDVKTCSVNEVSSNVLNTVSKILLNNGSVDKENIVPTRSLRTIKKLTL